MSQALLQAPALLDLVDTSTSANLAMAQKGSRADTVEDLAVAPKKGFFAWIMNGIEKAFAPPPGCDSTYLYWP